MTAARHDFAKSMKKLLKFIPIVSFLTLFPILAFAQVRLIGPGGGCANNGTISYILCTIQQLLNAVVPVLMALGVVYFVWGVVQYVIGDSEEAKKKGRDRIIYGIIGFAVIIGLWGLVNIVVNTLGFGAQNLAPSLVTTTTGAGSGATCDVGTDVQTFLGFITCIIENSVIPLIFAVAIVMFIWGAVNFFIINSDEEAKRAQGRQFMIWGIIALTVMVSVWGLVSILGGSFGLNTSVLPKVTPPGQSP